MSVLGYVCEMYILGYSFILTYCNCCISKKNIYR